MVSYAVAGTYDNPQFSPPQQPSVLDYGAPPPAQWSSGMIRPSGYRTILTLSVTGRGPVFESRLGPISTLGDFAIYMQLATLSSVYTLGFLL
ncbi:hypothetical protein LY76DRAFT_405710 [Colletotrichum caudatum]|nr:hypothetical protein LY76DRAFT_405710 [Colletotrichum caudatum]